VLPHNGKDERWRANCEEEKEEGVPRHPLDLFCVRPAWV
jgi:hypothetical protein